MSGIRLTVLGCAGSYPGPDTAASGYLVQGGGVSVLVDFGPGCLANLWRHVHPGDVDAVVLTHAHPDHWVDVVGLETAWTYGFGKTGLPVYGTPETRHLVAALVTEYEERLDWTDLDETSTLRLGGLEIGFAATDHYVETLAVRVAGDGAVLGYSADTGPGWSIEALGRGLDLALCEATLPTEAEGDGILHLSARQAGAMARQAGVERLVLTHLQPGVSADDARRAGGEAFGRPVELASIHARWDL